MYDIITLYCVHLNDRTITVFASKITIKNKRRCYILQARVHQHTTMQDTHSIYHYSNKLKMIRWSQYHMYLHIHNMCEWTTYEKTKIYCKSTPAYNNARYTLMQYNHTWHKQYNMSWNNIHTTYINMLVNDHTNHNTSTHQQTLQKHHPTWMQTHTQLA